MRRLLLLLTLAACGGGDGDCEDAVGHDEDGDGTDDGCDPCPFADDDDLATDSDGDGITGVCDPDPTTKNTRLKFAGFGAEDAEVALTGGTLADDSFHVTDASAGTGAAAVWGDNLDRDRVWVLAGITVDAIGTAGVREAGLVVDAAAVPAAPMPNGSYCAVGEADVPTPGTDYIEVFTRQQPAADETIASDQAVLYLSGLKQAVIEVAHARAATPALHCAFGVPGNRAIIEGSPAPAGVGGVGVAVGVFAQAVDAKFGFLFVLGDR